MKSYQIIIHGRVQGVGFRYSTKEIAKKLHIRGFVKNQSDGTVLIEALGEDDYMDEFIKWCRNGNSFSWVDDISIADIPTPQFTDFVIR